MSDLALQVDRTFWRQSFAISTLIALAVVTLYEAAVAVGLFAIGNEPGENAFGAEVIRAAGLVALLAGFFVSVAGIRGFESISSWVRMLLPVAGATAVVSTAYAFDPYFAPHEIRYVGRAFPPPPGSSSSRSRRSPRRSFR